MYQAADAVRSSACRYPKENGPILKTLILATYLLTVGIAPPVLSQSGRQDASVTTFAQETAVQALNFKQGDAQGFVRPKKNFSPEGWKDFVRSMQPFLDATGAPTFTSSFVQSGTARVVSSENGLSHVRVPGTLVQSNQLGRTSYRAALNVTVGGDPLRIHKLEQITCVAGSTACS